MNKWIPNIFYKKPDGGVDSGVTGYFLIQWKPVFSIGILHFQKGSRDNYHSHAFNALTWWVWGDVTEEIRNGDKKGFQPSLKPKLTKRNCVHKVIAHKDSYALTFRGPWEDVWHEYTPEGERISLTHGRKVL